MRTIEFRGLRVDGERWAHGDLLHPHQGNPDTFIAVENGHIQPVIPDSIGQFTGLYDKNGVKVFEGDNVTINGKEYFILFNMGVFVAEPVTGSQLSLIAWEFNGTDITVIGNLHEPATVRK